ncbi:NADH oxidase [Jeotgalibaca dankookensis]|uniref:NADH oxidase n=1 Tax=Jeotgalibaca dankookensis TaxID=708126 RepID=A0A1S6IMK2_9LACT|nr:hypothetical protein [Jeotgalibaca dankookensis]AQS52770.1 NADH oxidase [Jeotgalibaca dankookensis]
MQNEKIKEVFEFPCGLNIENRIVLAPMSTDSGTEKGGLSTEDVDFILKRSEGFGMVILGSHSVSPSGNAFKRGWNIYNPANAPILTKLVEKLHEKNVKVVIQIYHAGRLAQPAFIEGKQPIAPSRIPANRKFASYPRDMTEIEIQQTIKDFRVACEIAMEIGFDGVELHGANTYLLQQFYSAHSNRRQDRWGGSRTKRMTFLIEVVDACIKAIKEKAKRPFLLGYRFSPEELETPGIRMADTKILLTELTKLPLDYVHISLSNYQKKSQEGLNIIEELNQVIPPSIPFIGCGNIQTPKEVKEISEMVSLFSVGNATLSDPLWAKKILQGNHDIKTSMGMKDQKSLAIPLPLWKSMLKAPLVFFKEDLAKEAKK